MKKFARFIVGLAVLLGLVLGAMDVYFHRIFPIALKVETIAKARMNEYHVIAMTDQQIPDMFKQAVISTEDRRFQSDPGIDPIGIARSLLVDIHKDGYVEGGSTITQQLVDNTLLSKQKTLHRKLMQAFYAIGLYDTMSKDEVFQLYANVIYFGNGAYGLHNAAMTYFGKPPEQCNASELTMLAGLPNAPSVYDPFRHFSLARERQHIVLENMVDNGVLSNTQANTIYAEPLHLKKQS